MLSFQGIIHFFGHFHRVGFQTSLVQEGAGWSKSVLLICSHGAPESGNPIFRWALSLWINGFSSSRLSEDRPDMEAGGLFHFLQRDCFSRRDLLKEGE